MISTDSETNQNSSSETYFPDSVFFAYGRGWASSMSKSEDVELIQNPASDTGLSIQIFDFVHGFFLLKLLCGRYPDRECGCSHSHLGFFE
jgi:hypothetical protein